MVVQKRSDISFDGNLHAPAFLAKCLGDENRLKILILIAEEEKSVSHIVEALSLSQPLVSHHLKELKRSLLVKVERRGPFMFEDWLEELEKEVIAFVKKSATETPDELAEHMGLSHAGAKFLLAKMKREGKIS